MISAVEAVLAVQEKTWIPTDLDTSQTFFSANDWWNYIKSYHPNMCHQCDFYGDMPFFSGNDLRITFPYLEIVDENTIAVHVHNHCTCELQRVFRSLEP